MNIKKLNEEIKKFLEEKQYELKIITGRGRGEDGEITTDTFAAKNDAEALLYVFTNYDLQNSGYLNGEYEEDGDLEEEDLEKVNKIKQAAKTGENVEEAVKLMTDIYFDGFDISDYYDDIIYLTAPDGYTVIEDNIDIDEWFGDGGLEDDDLEDATDIEGTEIDTDSYEEEKRDELVQQVKDLVRELRKTGLHIYVTKLEMTSLSKGKYTYTLSKEDDEDFDHVIGHIYLDCSQDRCFGCNLFLPKENLLKLNLTLTELKQILLNNVPQVLEYKNRK